MQRNKLIDARRIETPTGSFNPVPTPSSGPNSVIMASNNESWHQEANYGGIKLYNPNEMAQQQPLNTSYQLNQQENPWVNQDPNAYSWSTAAVSTPAASSFASQQHYDNQPMYEQQQQPNMDWNASQNPQQVPVYRSSNDTWNWGTGDESSDVSGQNSFETQMNQQPREVPDGQDQGFSGYGGWNGGQPIQTSYVWPGVQTSVESVVSSPVVSQNSHLWGQSNVVSSEASMTGVSLHETNGETSAVVERNELNENGTELDARRDEEVVRSDLSATVTDEATSQFAYDDGSTVSTFFSRSSEEKESVTTSETVVTQSIRSEMGTEGAVDQHLDPYSFGEAPRGVWNHVPYIRADSCISNSSLMTYNHSVAGSQELLSGSFYGDESHTSLVSLSGLSQAVEDLHLSSHGHHQQHHLKHPLHQSFPPNRLLDHVGDSSEVCESLPIFADRKTIVSSVSPSTFVRRLSVPNALISANQEVVETTNDGVTATDEPSTVEEDEESATNVEVLPSVAKVDASAEISSSSSLAENAEIVDSKAKLTSDLWSRENSAFQPLPSRSSLTIIQQEVPDGVESGSEQPIQSDVDLPLTTESANLETVPDNVERPLDTDLVEEGKQPFTPTRSTLHSSVARQRTRNVIGGSPSAALWENPDLVSVQGLEIGLVPASASPQPTPPQGALLVPQLSHQQELLDNPLGLVSASPLKKEELIITRSTELNASGTVVDTRLTSDKDSRDVRTVPLRELETPNATPLDLSSRAAPQGQSATEEDAGFSLRRSLRGVGETSQVRDVSSPSSVTSRPEEDVRRRHGPYPDLADQDRSRRQWPEQRDDRDGPWENRRRYSIDRDEGWEHRDSGDGGRRRGDYPPENERRWGDDRVREYDRSRDAPYPPPLSHDDAYYGYRERDRSRPSSRSSTQDYDPRDSNRRFPDQRQYPLPDDSRQPLQQPPRPSSRVGSESDQDSRRRRGGADYDYYRDPRYAGYDNYYQYSRDPRYDPRQYPPNPYYNANSYNYGYYAEMYDSDPRYRAYYESLANYGRYAAAAAGQYGYEDYDRRSVHSGRSSVTDDSQGRNEQLSNAFHRESPNVDQTVQQSALEQSTIYPYDGSSYYQTDSTQAVQFDQSQMTYEEIPPQRLTPAKFSTPHVRATFNDSGNLVIVPANNVADGHVAQVEICDLQTVLSNDPVSKELENFPGPLIRCDTHKNDVIQFCLQKVRKAKEDASLPDRDSCVLIWELLVLLIRQNGVVVGTDIAELLLRDRDAVGTTSLEAEQGDKSAENSEINSPDEGVVMTRNFSATNLSTLSSEEHVTKKFREFLLFGHKKDALEWAMRHRLWGHALFLASKMDTRTYAMVMTRFANSLALNDPLQSLYQLMSGRQPAAVTCIADEKWGDWRPHLAMILSNSSPRPDLDRRSVVALGDTLAARGCLHASHFCYLMAQVDFGVFSKKSSKLVLIGSNHSLPFARFATNEAIQCTEVYEYVQSLANPQFILPSLQVFKYLYATRLAEYGQYQEALHYCEVIASTIAKAPVQFNAELVDRVYQLGYRLKYYDPYYSQAEEMGDPSWLCDLGNILNAFSDGTIQQYPDLTEHPSQIEPVPSYSDYSGGVDAAASNTSAQTSSVSQFSNSVTQDSDAHSELNTANTSQQYQGYGETYQQPNLYSNFVGSQQPVMQSGGGENVNQPLVNYQPTPLINQYGGGAASRDVHDAVPPPLSRRDSTDYYGASTRKNSFSVSASQSYDHQKRKSSGDWATTASNDIGSSKVDSVKKPTSTEKSKPKQGSWLGGIFGRFSLKPKNQMILPEDKNPAIVWDPDTGRWMNTEGEDEADTAGPIAPPKDLELTSSPPKPFAAVLSPDPMTFNVNNSGPTTMPTTLLPVSMQGNRFKLKHGRGMRQNYVDVLSGNTVPMNPSIPSIVPQSANQMPMQYFVPAPVSGGDVGAMDFVTPSMTSGQTRVANPGSRGGSPHQFDNESEEVTNQTEAVGQGQPLIFDTTSMSSLGVATGPTAAASYQKMGGVHKKYGGRYPR